MFDLETYLYHKEYDPEYAHWYYMQNRKLKGKTSKTKAVNKARSSSSRTGSGNQHVSKKAYMPTKTPKQLRTEADARVASIRTRLNKLTSYLDSLMKKAIAEDDAKKSKSKDSKSSPSSSSSQNTNRSQKEKQADHDYYEKNKTKIANDRKKDAPKKPAEKDTQAEIDKVKAQIVKVRAELKAAIAKAKQSHNPTKTAVKGR